MPEARGPHPILLVEQTTRRSYTYKLKPTPHQAQMLERSLTLYRHGSNVVIGER
jgi:hypothetical protein